MASLYSRAATLLPQSQGYLPLWIGLIGAVALANGVGSIVSGGSTREIYNRTPFAHVSPLASRLFGTWTLTSGVVRLVAAYNIHDRALYQVTMSTYAIALFHFSSELFSYESLTLNRANTGPFIIASASLIWMATQYNYYLA